MHFSAHLFVKIKLDKLWQLCSGVLSFLEHFYDDILFPAEKIEAEKLFMRILRVPDAF